MANLMDSNITRLIMACGGAIDGWFDFMLAAVDDAVHALDQLPFELRPGGAANRAPFTDPHRLH